MFVFGHSVLGFKLVKLLKKENPRFFVEITREDRLLLLGTLLPDLIDKPLFYLFHDQISLVTGTRTFGHMLWPALVFSLWRPTRMLGFGMLTHLGLDHIPEVIQSWVTGALDFNYRWEGFFWPVFGLHFPVFPYDSMLSHGLGILKRLPHLLGEGAGIAFLFWDWISFRKSLK